MTLVVLFLGAPVITGTEGLQDLRQLLRQLFHDYRLNYLLDFGFVAHRL